MPVKKYVLMLCVLLAFVSPATAFVQGDEQFFFSSDILEEVNPNLGDDSAPSYKYTSVTNPGITLNDVLLYFRLIWQVYLLRLPIRLKERRPYIPDTDASVHKRRDTGLPQGFCRDERDGSVSSSDRSAF